jgi:hypothetical protein
LNVVIWIFEDKAFYSFARTCVAGSHKITNKANFHSTPIALRIGAGSLCGNELSLEQVLLPTLPHIGQSPIARSGSSLAKTHRLPSFRPAPASIALAKAGKRNDPRAKIWVSDTRCRSRLG